MAVDMFFSLGVLIFTPHYKHLFAVAMRYILQLQMPKIWGCFSTPKHPLVYSLVIPPVELEILSSSSVILLVMMIAHCKVSELSNL